MISSKDEQILLQHSLEKTPECQRVSFVREGKKMTDKEAKAFYNAAAWKHKRMQILERDHYECQDCRKRLKDAVAAGHILQGEDGASRRMCGSSPQLSSIFK